MNIDWDEVVQDADNTPRSLLAEVLALADEIEELVVIIHDKDGHQREWYVADETKHYRLEPASSQRCGGRCVQGDSGLMGWFIAFVLGTIITALYSGMAAALYFVVIVFTGAMVWMGTRAKK